MSADAIEAEIKAKGLTAPRIAPEDIEAAIASEHYFAAADGVFGAMPDDATIETHPVPDCLELLTFCVLVMRNGFTVVGKSACASPENFDAELGRKIARQDAISQCWPLLGYELRSKLASEPARPKTPAFTPYTRFRHAESWRDMLTDGLHYRATMPDGKEFSGLVQPFPGMPAHAIKELVICDINHQARAAFNESSGKVAT